MAEVHVKWSSKIGVSTCLQWLPIIAILNLGRLGKIVTLPVFPNCRRPSQTTGEVFLRSEISNITDHLRYISIFPTYEKPALIYHWRPITFSFVLPSHFYFVGFYLFHDVRFKSVLFHFGFLKLCCSSWICHLFVKNYSNSVCATEKRSACNVLWTEQIRLQILCPKRVNIFGNLMGHNKRQSASWWNIPLDLTENRLKWEAIKGKSNWLSTGNFSLWFQYVILQKGYENRRDYRPVGVILT